jgi:hypothetical protein
MSVAPACRAVRRLPKSASFSSTKATCSLLQVARKFRKLYEITENSEFFPGRDMLPAILAVTGKRRWGTRELNNCKT